MPEDKAKGRPRTTGRVQTVSDEEFERWMSARSRRSFMVGGLALLGGIAGWTWLKTRDPEGGTAWPLRRALDLNERVARGYFSDDHRAETYQASLADMPRVNGTEGLASDLDLEAWRLRVTGLADEEISLSMDDLRAHARVDMATELRCIEGWSSVVRWGGVRFSEVIAGIVRGAGSVDDVRESFPYVGISTPDGGYFVGLDTASAFHPQTLLCYEMAGRPLTPAHGAPLRLVIPVKYGIKNIKRIGTIHFSNDRPRDYWGERGYDWYAGL